MSLGLALNNALSGLAASKQSMAVISQNIANANNPEYSRQEVTLQAATTGGMIGNGVKVEDVTRTVDEFISKTVVARTTQAARADVIADSYESLQLYMGSPGEENSIDIYIANYFENLSKLEATPEEPSLKFSTVNSAVTLSNEISSLAKNIEDLRYESELKLTSSINNVNFNLAKIHDLNVAIKNAASTNQSQNVISDEMTSSIKELAKELDVNYVFDQFGAVTISTADGIPLVENGYYKLQYTRATSVDTLINNTGLNAIKVSYVNEDGSIETERSFTLATSGNKDSIDTELTGGQIKGYMEMRDVEFPRVLNQLDELSKTITAEINRIHNNGVAYPPANTLTGTQLVDPSASNVWSGSFTIQAMGADGDPLASPYASSAATGFEALTLNLGELTDANGVAGQPEFQTIIDEINAHFGSPGNRVGFNDINGDNLVNNIELIALSDSIQEDTGSFDFSLELNNLTTSDKTFRVTAVTTSDPNIGVSGVSAITDYTSLSGAKSIDSDLNISLDMSNPLVNGGPYMVSVEIEVDDGNGGTYTDIIDYEIPEAASGLLNDRYAANSISGGGDASFEAPSTSQPYLTASLVDANGVEIEKDANGDYTEEGYFKITGNGDNRFGIAELDSTHKGADLLGTNATGYGFSHYLGLNNFYVDDGVTQGSAINMAVRADIVDAPAKISTAKLTADSDNTFAVSKGGNAAVIEMSQLLFTSVSFDEADGLPASTISISDYTAQFLGFGAAVATDAIEFARTENLVLEGFLAQDDSVRGVNIDEELANTIIYQNAYAANARVINVTKELFDTLINAI